MQTVPVTPTDTVKKEISRGDFVLYSPTARDSSVHFCIVLKASATGPAVPIESPWHNGIQHKVSLLKLRPINEWDRDARRLTGRVYLLKEKSSIRTQVAFKVRSPEDFLPAHLCPEALSLQRQVLNGEI